MDQLHQGTPIRQPAAAQFLIDSLDRYKLGFPLTGTDSTTSSNWRTNLPSYVLNGYFTRLAVTQIQFQYNLPNMLEGYNNDLYIFDGTDYYLVTIPQGFYTPTELATAFELALNTDAPTIGAVTANWEVSFVNGVFLIAADAVFYIVNPVESNNQGPEASATTYAKALITLGLLNTDTGAILNPTASKYELYGSVPTMLATRFIDIHSSYITKFQDVKDSSTSQTLIYNSQIARIYPAALNTRIDISPDAGPCANPYILCIDYNTPKQIRWNPSEALANFDIQLRDEFGDLVPWSTQYGCEYLLTCLASET